MDTFSPTTWRDALRNQEIHNPSWQERFAIRRPDGTSPWKVNLPPEHVRPKEAGVLVLLFEVGKRSHVVLTRRRDDLQDHAGQISFPGGARESQDHDLQETALRETQEELGVDPSSLDVIGQLGDVYIGASNFMVTPTVAVSEARPDFEPDPAEVDAVLEVPLMAILHPDAIEEEVRQFGEREYIVPFYRWEDHKIWGATARMLHVFATAVRLGRRL